MTANEPSAPGTHLVRFTRPAPATLGVTGIIERVTGLALGATGIALQASVDAIERFVPTEPNATDEPRIAGPMGDIVHAFPGAVLGVAFALRRQVLSTSATVERTTARVVNAIGAPRVMQAPIGVAERYIDDLNQKAQLEQAHNQELVTEFGRRLAPALAEAIVTRLDVGEIVAQLPVDAIIEQVDVNAIIQRVDINAILDRVDVNTLMDRVDVERILARVDVDALMARVDLGPIVSDVLDEVDIAGIVRDSTGTVAGDMVDTGRVTAMRLDLFTERLVDRILLRRRARRLTIEGYDPDAPEPGAGAEHHAATPSTAPPSATGGAHRD